MEIHVPLRKVIHVNSVELYEKGNNKTRKQNGENQKTRSKPLGEPELTHTCTIVKISVVRFLLFNKTFGLSSNF